MPVHSNVLAVSLRHAAGGIARSTFLLTRGLRTRRSSTADVVQQTLEVFCYDRRAVANLQNISLLVPTLAHKRLSKSDRPAGWAGTRSSRQGSVASEKLAHTACMCVRYRFSRYACQRRGRFGIIFCEGWSFLSSGDRQTSFDFPQQNP